MNSINIRSIQTEDNPVIAKVIREVLVGLGVPKVGTAYADPSLDTLSEDYQADKARYFVFEVDKKVIGGAGIAHLSGEDESFCELQKMYFLDEARGKGWGQLMMDKCLAFAKEKGYNFVYIETLPSMEAAQKLYLKNGFKYIDKRLGKTGHFSCTVWMLKNF